MACALLCGDEGTASPNSSFPCHGGGRPGEIVGEEVVDVLVLR